jgi:hypothetical protein
MGARHIFLSNEPDTLREMRAFLVSLKEMCHVRCA